MFLGKAENMRSQSEALLPQPCDLYGGWTTAEIEGPFKDKLDRGGLVA